MMERLGQSRGPPATSLRGWDGALKGCKNLSPSVNAGREGERHPAGVEEKTMNYGSALRMTSCYPVYLPVGGILFFCL